MFVAIYLPVLPPKFNGVDPTKRGFETEAEAWEYCYDQMCSRCKEERRAALAGEKVIDEDVVNEKDEDAPVKFEPSDHPACAFEWEVLSHEQFVELNSEESLEGIETCKK